MKIKFLLLTVFVLGLRDAKRAEGESKEAPTLSPIEADKYVVKNE